MAAQAPKQCATALGSMGVNLIMVIYPMGRNPFLESPTKQIQANGIYIYTHMFIYHGHPKPTLLEVFMVNNLGF